MTAGTKGRLRWVGIAAIAAVFALGFWARITSLKTSPESTGDESFFGYQSARLARGQSIVWKTGSGKPADPLYTLAGVPLHVVFPPSFALARVPAVTFGVLAVAALYAVSRRMFDRETALLASGLLASLPIAIIYSRIGWEYAEVPLLNALAIGFAAKGRRLALLATFLVGIHIAPTTLFLSPVLLACLFVAIARRVPDDPPRRLRSLVVTMSLASALVLSLGLLKRNNPTTRWLYETYHFGHCDWLLFFSGFEKMLLGFCQGAGTRTGPAIDAIFWSIVLSVLVLGTWRLWRRRAWEQLALIVGFLASFAGLHLVVGPGIFHPGLGRYPLFLVVPFCLSLACCCRTLLVVPAEYDRNSQSDLVWPGLSAACPGTETSPFRGTLRSAPATREALRFSRVAERWTSALRRVQIAGAVVVGFALLASYKLHFFDLFAYQSFGRSESFWTLRTEAADPMHRISGIVAQDLATAGPRLAKTTIVAEDWWCFKPVQYLLSTRNDVRVATVEGLAADRRDRVVRGRLGTGGYALVSFGSPLDKSLRATYPQDALRLWYVQVNWRPCYVLYRLKRDGEHVPSHPGLAKGRPARATLR